MDITWLQGYWGVHILVFGALVVREFVTGKCWDKSYGERSPDDPVPWYHIRKRIYYFYVISAVWHIWLLWTTLASYCFDVKPEGYTAAVIEWAISPQAENADSTCILLGFLAILAHTFRRIYECMSISVFSRRQSMNLLEWAWSAAFYVMQGLTVLAEGPSLFSQSSGCISIWNLSWRHVVAVPLFVWASNIHHHTHRGLAKVRRNRAGHIVTTSYKMPKGGWFEYITCPHYFGEVLIYISLGLIIGLGHITWWLLVTYVIINQIYLAHATKEFYLKKFSDYPKDRKMIFPYLL